MRMERRWTSKCIRAWSDLSSTLRRCGQTYISLCVFVPDSRRPRRPHILRYLKYTTEFRLWYSVSSSLELVGYADADYAWCRVDRKSTFGLCCFLRSSLVCWSSRKQTSVANSTTEAEYVAAASCCSQILWMIHTMRDFGLIFKSVPLFCDNTSAISLAKNPCFH